MWLLTASTPMSQPVLIAVLSEFSNPSPSESQHNPRRIYSAAGLLQLRWAYAQVKVYRIADFMRPNIKEACMNSLPQICFFATCPDFSIKLFRQES